MEDFRSVEEAVGAVEVDGVVVRGCGVWQFIIELELCKLDFSEIRTYFSVTRLQSDAVRPWVRHRKLWSNQLKSQLSFTGGSVARRIFLLRTAHNDLLPSGACLESTQPSRFFMCSTSTLWRPTQRQYVVEAHHYSSTLKLMGLEIAYKSALQMVDALSAR